ncbi:MAG: hypothetical protein QW044_00850 [Candidatus Anstonellales archaeon]
MLIYFTFYIKNHHPLFPSRRGVEYNRFSYLNMENVWKIWNLNGKSKISFLRIS